MKQQLVAITADRAPALIAADARVCHEPIAASLASLGARRRDEVAACERYARAAR